MVERWQAERLHAAGQVVSHSTYPVRVGEQVSNLLHLWRIYVGGESHKHFPNIMEESFGLGDPPDQQITAPFQVGIQEGTEVFHLKVAPMVLVTPLVLGSEMLEVSGPPDAGRHESWSRDEGGWGFLGVRSCCHDMQNEGLKSRH